MADPLSAPTVDDNHAPENYGGGALGGFMSIYGPRIKAKQQEELNQRAMERDHFWKQMNDPALSVQPGDDDATKTRKQQQLAWLQAEYAKRSGTESKGLLQKAIPFIQHLRGHKVDGQDGGGGGGGESLGLPASMASGGMPAPPQQGAAPTAASAPAAIPPPPSGADVASTIQHHALTTEAAQKERDYEAQTTGPITARAKLFHDHPEYLKDPVTASMILGHPLPGIGRTMGTGVVTAKEARDMGIDVDDQIPDDQLVQMKQSMLGTTVTPTDAVPSGRAVGTDGKLITKQQADMDKEARQLSYWHTKDAIQFQHRVVLQGTALQNALAKADYTGAKKIINDSKVALNSAVNRTSTMEKNLTEAKKGDQQAMVSLAGNHVLMITGAGEKGNIRATKLIWEDAVNSAPWLARAEAKFDSDGYLSGVTLTPSQMDQMVRLAHEKVETMKGSTDNLSNTFAADLAEKKPRRGQATVPPPPTGAAPAAAGQRRVIDLTH